MSDKKFYIIKEREDGSISFDFWPEKSAEADFYATLSAVMMESDYYKDLTRIEMGEVDYYSENIDEDGTDLSWARLKVVHRAVRCDWNTQMDTAEIEVGGDFMSKLMEALEENAPTID